MADAAHIGLDNPAFQGRLRQQQHRSATWRKRSKTSVPTEGGVPSRKAVQQELARIFADPDATDAQNVLPYDAPVEAPVAKPQVATIHPAPSSQVGVLPQASPATQVMAAAQVAQPHPLAPLTPIPAKKEPVKSKAKLSHRDRSRIVAPVNGSKPSKTAELPLAEAPVHILPGNTAEQEQMTDIDSLLSAAPDAESSVEAGIARAETPSPVGSTPIAHTAEPEIQTSANEPGQTDETRLDKVQTVLGSASQSLIRPRSFKLGDLRRHVSGWQLAMLGFACMTLIVGVAISIQTSRINSAAQAELTSFVRSYGDQ